jgi:predicted transcriptional regulator
MATWLFLTNHALVLYRLARKPLITAREVADAIGITERAVRKIIADLDAASYIKKSKEGRRVRYSINPSRTLRHDKHADVPIIDFLAVLGWKRR